MLDGLLALVDKSLVVADETAGAHALPAAGDDAPVRAGATSPTRGIDAPYRDRHADYYADYVLSRRPQLHGAGDQAALDDVERELENIRVALRQAADDHSSSRFEELFSAALHALAWARPAHGGHVVGRGAPAAARSGPRGAHRGARLRRIVTQRLDLTVAEEMAAAAADLSRATGPRRARWPRPI